jgi:hypothetical protein
MVKLPALKDLSVEDRIFVLEIMRDAIHDGIKKTVSTFAYKAFVKALNTGDEFDPSDVWLSLPGSSRAHFEHAASILADLDTEIAYGEQALADDASEIEEEPDDTVDEDPFVAEQGEDQ